MKLNLISLLLLSFGLYAISCVGGKGEKESTDEIVSDSLKIDTSTIDHKIETTIVYDSVRIGQQVWMQRNLDVITFRNGDSIFNAQTDEDWLFAAKNKIPAWCYYNNDKELGKKYGVLYNQYAFVDKRNLAPRGWRLPTMDDWGYLTKYPRINSVVIRDQLKEFNSPIYMEKAKLRVLAGGHRFYNKKTQKIEFRRLGEAAEFWGYSIIENERGIVFPAPLSVLPSQISYDVNIYYGLSVRLIKGG